MKTKPISKTFLFLNKVKNKTIPLAKKMLTENINKIENFVKGKRRASDKSGEKSANLVKIIDIGQVPFKRAPKEIM